MHFYKFPSFSAWVLSLAFVFSHEQCNFTKNKFLFDLKLTYFDGIVWCDNALEVCKPSFICRQQEQEQKLKVN